MGRFAIEPSKVSLAVYNGSSLHRIKLRCKWNGQLISGAGQQNKVGDIIFTWMAATFETVDGNGITTNGLSF